MAAFRSSVVLISMLLGHSHQMPKIVTVVEPPPLVSISQLPKFWQCIVFRESTDNGKAVNRISGDQGYFQIALSSWREYKPIWISASEPIFASLSQQYEVALYILRGQGVRAWQSYPLCAGVGNA